MPEAEARAALAGYEDRVAIAAVNTRDEVVLSGDADALAELAEEGRRTGRRIRPLDVSHAFHSPHMDPVLDDFAAVAATLEYRPARIPLVSTVTGLDDDGAMSTPEYWVRQIRATVRFSDAVGTLLGRGVTRFAEIGPGAALTVPLERTLERARALDDTTAPSPWRSSAPAGGSPTPCSRPSPGCTRPASPSAGTRSSGPPPDPSRTCRRTPSGGAATGPRRTPSRRGTTSGPAATG
ncbi:hypothetical protein A4U61_08480 [Streptomyces sp. H-KF8]|nr:acyltransferase domain-containing protein [Streptomyces sp. H-KF8]OBQ51684.1 hypothetical protein A4U61_08480 [Streptomyces sp. H-KF8]